MKIFWSWQSDTPGQIGRFFVRDALNAAISQLQQNDEVVEPAEREARSAMQLDQDRKGVPGSPDLARVILEKIESSAVFVADVTAIGFVMKPTEQQGDDATEKPKKLINSNVAIELGYALHALTDRALLMVMNDYYGNREELPFDLKHKAGPIIFSLPPDADKAAIGAAQRKLVSQLVEALKLCVATAVEEERRQKAFQPAENASGMDTYFEQDEILASAGYPGEQEFRFEAKRIVYLRLFPTHHCDPVGLARMTKTFEARKPCPMSMTVGGLPGRNQHGPIIFDFEGKTTITALTQGFVSGELWGINGTIFQPHAQRNFASQQQTIVAVLPMISLEKLYVRVLGNYLKTVNELGVVPPFTLMMGITGLKGTYLTAPDGDSGRGQFLGPVLAEAIHHSYPLVNGTATAMTTVLRTYFTAIYDLAASSRSDVLTDRIVGAHDLPSR